MPKEKPQTFISAMDEQEEWSERAACRGENPRMWDTRLVNKQTEITDDTIKAQEICADCPVMMDCLIHAAVYSIKTGIWGGCTPEERQAWAEREDMVAA